MTSLESDVSIRIALAFLQFLSCVKSSGAVDTRKLDNLKETLMTVFNINPSMVETSITPSISLYNLFSLDEQNGSTSLFPIAGSQIGPSLVDLFHEFHMAVTAIGFFESSTGEDYKKRKSCAKKIFKSATEVLRGVGHQTFSRMNLADGLKILGNNAMHSGYYGKAIVMYSCALELCKDNAIYFRNRAAAYTKIGKYKEAICDCYEAIRLEPRQALAYYRLGCAFYEQGNTLPAIRHGFLKVLELDPHDEAAMVSLQVADSKLKDELAQMREQIDMYMENGVTRRPTGQQSTSTVELVFRGPEEEVAEEIGETSGGDGDTAAVSSS